MKRAGSATSGWLVCHRMGSPKSLFGTCFGALLRRSAMDFAKETSVTASVETDAESG